MGPFEDRKRVYENLIKLFSTDRVDVEKIAISLEITIIFIIAYTLWYRVFLPAAYLIASVILGVLFAISILKSEKRYLVFGILLIYVVLRNVYYLATHYACIQFGDSYLNYGVIRTWMEKGSIFIIHTKAPSFMRDRFIWYSAWPSLETIALFLSSVSGIDPLYIVISFPCLLSIVLFGFVYFLIEKTRFALKLSGMVTILSLMIYATSPETIYYSSIFFHNNLGLLLLTILFYIVSMRISKPHDYRYFILILLLSISLVIAHHFTSFIATLYLLLFSAFIVISKYLTTRIGSTTRIERLYLSFLGNALIMFAFLILYWDNFAIIIWPHIASATTRTIGVLKEMNLRELFVWSYGVYPESFTPTWALALLNLHDAITYIPAIFGFLFIYAKKYASPQKFFVICSAMTLSIIFLITFIMAVEPKRTILMTMPFVCLSNGIFYDKLMSKSKYLSRVLVIIVIVLFISSSFVGLWGHRYIPAHLYDPSINQAYVGEHNIHYLRLNKFFDKHVEYENVNKILADDVYPLYVILHPNDYEKIQIMGIQELVTDDNIIAVELRELNLYYYYHFLVEKGNPPAKPWEVEPMKLELENHLKKNFNLIYADGDFRIWSAHLVVSSRRKAVTIFTNKVIN